MINIKNNIKGVTLIEALAAIILLSVSMLGYIQFQQAELKNNKFEELEYDFKILMESFSEKLLKDNLINSEYWIDYKNFENYNEHFLKNLTSANGKCKENTVLIFSKDYIKCHNPLVLKYFKIDLIGNIHFDDNKFKYYEMNFTPKDYNYFKDVNTLKNALKRVLKNSPFYSDINYLLLNNNSSVTYKECLSNKEKCYLQLTFGIEFNYLDNKNKSIIEKSVNEFDIDKDLKNDLENDLGKNSNENNYSDNLYTNSYENKNSYGEDSDKKTIKDYFNKNGVTIDDEDLNKVIKKIDEIKSNPEIVSEIQKKMQTYCSQYDEADYYFMSKFEKDNACYKSYGSKIK